jgi:hypothetical protein
MGAMDDQVKLLPMLDELCVLGLSGTQLHRALENGVSQYHLRMAIGTLDWLRFTYVSDNIELPYLGRGAGTRSSRGASPASRACASASTRRCPPTHASTQPRSRSMVRRSRRRRSTPSRPRPTSRWGRTATTSSRRWVRCAALTAAAAAAVAARLRCPGGPPPPPMALLLWHGQCHVS